MRTQSEIATSEGWILWCTFETYGSAIDLGIEIISPIPEYLNDLDESLPEVYFCNDYQTECDDLGFYWQITNMTLALKLGIAPGQPFLVHFHEPEVHTYGGYDTPTEYDVYHFCDIIYIEQWSVAQTVHNWQIYLHHRKSYQAETRLHGLRQRWENELDIDKMRVRFYHKAGWSTNYYDPMTGPTHTWVVGSLETAHLPGRLIGVSAEHSSDAATELITKIGIQYPHLDTVKIQELIDKGRHWH